MTIRGAIQTVFGALGNRAAGIWKEIGGYRATFLPWNRDVFANETCRACIRTLAEHTSKANAKLANGDKRLENLLNIRPNYFMNGKDFLYKIRVLYELYNTAFIYIRRDEVGRCVSLYPIPQCSSEAVEIESGLYIRFYLPSGDVLVVPWTDLAVVRKDYHKSDIYGDDNTAISTSLELLNTTNQGLANAVKSTANLRGILKSTKAMLSDDDVKKQRDRFVTDYMAMENTSGVAMIDSTLTFTPIQMQPVLASYKSVEDLRNNIYRYYGMNEGAVTNSLVGDAGEAFYEGAVEPFLIALSAELSYKIYTDRQRKLGSNIVYESNRMQYMTMASKLALVAMVDRGAMVPNEWRAVMNLAPIEGGDQPIRRLDTAPTSQVAEPAEDAADAEEEKDNADKTE